MCKIEGKVCSFEVDGDVYEDWLIEVSIFVVDIIMDLWNVSVFGNDNDILVVWGIDFYYQDEGCIK